MRAFFSIILFFSLNFFLNAQVEKEEEKEDGTTTENEVLIIDQNGTLSSDVLMIKNPLKASLYSAIVPGMGQIYNKKWWKAPIVWGLMGVGVGVIVYYNDRYTTFRGHYLSQLNGQPNPYDFLSVEQLAVIQSDNKRNRDYAIALTALAYILNIIDATVDAHLYGVKRDPDLSFQPSIIQDWSTNQFAYGLTLNFKF